MPKCVVCNNPNAQRQAEHDDFARFDCPRCGSFVLSDTAENELDRLFTKVPLRRSLMSYTLRRMQRPDQKPHKIQADELPTFWREERLPSPLEQADNFILWLGDNQQNRPDAWAFATSSEIAATVGIAVSADGNDSAGWGWLNAQLHPMKLYRLHQSPPSSDKHGFILEMAGWEKYYSLKKHRVESRTAFMALKFNEAVMDRVVADCVRPALQRTGFELRILTDQQGAGLIDNQIRAALLAARFVISDLTHGSYGAYWEAGFAEGRGVPVIYTCAKAAWDSNKSHFDTNHMATIIWDINHLKKAEDALVAMIRATLRAEAKQSDD